VARGATGAQPGSHADEQTGKKQCQAAGLKFQRQAAASQNIQSRTRNQAEDKREAPETFAVRGRGDQPAQNAGDAGDPAVQREQQYRGETNERAAD
jgi:hypothetical protein